MRKDIDFKWDPSSVSRFGFTQTARFDCHSNKPSITFNFCQISERFFDESNRNLRPFLDLKLDTARIMGWESSKKKQTKQKNVCKFPRNVLKSEFPLDVRIVMVMRWYLATGHWPCRRWITIPLRCNSVTWLAIGSEIAVENCIIQSSEAHNERTVKNRLEPSTKD